MNWTELKTKIEAALPGDRIEIPKGIGPPPEGKIDIPKGVTVILSEPLPLHQIFIHELGQIQNKDNGSKAEWWGSIKP